MHVHIQYAYVHVTMLTQYELHLQRFLLLYVAIAVILLKRTGQCLRVYDQLVENSSVSE